MLGAELLPGVGLLLLEELFPELPVLLPPRPELLEPGEPTALLLGDPEEPLCCCCCMATMRLNDWTIC